MKIRKTGWVVWDKSTQSVLTRNRMFVFNSKMGAWLSADKERKGSTKKVVRVKVTVEINGKKVKQ